MNKHEVRGANPLENRDTVVTVAEHEPVEPEQEAVEDAAAEESYAETAQRCIGAGEFRLFESDAEPVWVDERGISAGEFRLLMKFGLMNAEPVWVDERGDEAVWLDESGNEPVWRRRTTLACDRLGA